jgi:hypothetical protein
MDKPAELGPVSSATMPARIPCGGAPGHAVLKEKESSFSEEKEAKRLLCLVLAPYRGAAHANAVRAKE